MHVVSAARGGHGRLRLSGFAASQLALREKWSRWYRSHHTRLMSRWHAGAVHEGYCNELQPTLPQWASVWNPVPSTVKPAQLVKRPQDVRWGVNESNNDCEHGDSGGWAVQHEMLCRSRCRKCARCRFYSFSYEASRVLPQCSWYRSCELSALLNTRATGYRTRRLPPRHAASKGTSRTANLSAHWPSTVPQALLSRPLAGDAGAAHHFAPLLTKLQSGAPISMLLLGSSIAGVYGGCTGPAPMLSDGCKCPKCCGTGCGHFEEVGWARAFFEAFNSTWPHARHNLYNLGVPAGSLIPSIVSCPLTYLAFEVDLVLFDFLTTPDGVVEQLVRMLLVRSPPPLLLSVEFFVDLVDKATGANVSA